MQPNNTEIVIYRTEDGRAKIDVRMEAETLWLTQAQIAQLFGRERSAITKHIRNILAEGEIDEKSNVQNLHIANSDKPVMRYPRRRLRSILPPCVADSIHTSQCLTASRND